MIIPVGGTARVGSCKQTSRASGGPGFFEVVDVVGYVVMVTPRFSTPPRRSCTIPLIAQSLNKRAMQRATSSISQNSHVFISPSTSNFFASVSSPAEMLSSNLVSRVGGYNYVHILNLGTNPDPPFPFILRFPIDPNTISRWQTSTSVGCMLYCQRRPELNIPTPAIYAYSCTHGSEFGDSLSKVWMDLQEEEKANMACQIADIMRTMRTKTAFGVIGGISPDGSACPLVDDVDVTDGNS